MDDDAWERGRVDRVNRRRDMDGLGVDRESGVLDSDSDSDNDWRNAPGGTTGGLRGGKTGWIKGLRGAGGSEGTADASKGAKLLGGDGWTQL